MTTVALRPATAADAPFLFEMLFEAVNWPGDERLSRSQIRATPEAMRYVDAWPAPGEFGFIAYAQPGYVLGACWVRLFPASSPGYGFVADDVPELMVAVASTHRRQGIGGALLAATIREARKRGFAKLSLSVEERNRASRLYSRLGFTQVGTRGESTTMVLDLAAPDAATADTGSDDTDPGTDSRGAGAA